MISRLFSSGSTTQLRKETVAQVDAILAELELIKKENKLLLELVSDHQLSINILIAANQVMTEDLNVIHAVLGARSSKDSRHFSFTFNVDSDDDLPN